MELAIKMGVVALGMANASIFWRERGRPNYPALLGANLVTVLIGAVILYTASLVP